MAAQTPLEATSSGFHRRPSGFLTRLWHFTGGETEATQYKTTACLPSPRPGRQGAGPFPRHFKKSLQFPRFKLLEEEGGGGSPHMQTHRSSISTRGAGCSPALRQLLGGCPCPQLTRPAPQGASPQGAGPQGDTGVLCSGKEGQGWSRGQPARGPSPRHPPWVHPSPQMPH